MPVLAALPVLPALPLLSVVAVPVDELELAPGGAEPPLLALHAAAITAARPHAKKRECRRVARPFFVAFMGFARRGATFDDSRDCALLGGPAAFER